MLSRFTTTQLIDEVLRRVSRGEKCPPETQQAMKEALAAVPTYMTSCFIALAPSVECPHCGETIDFADEPTLLTSRSAEAAP